MDFGHSFGPSGLLCCTITREVGKKRDRVVGVGGIPFYRVGILFVLYHKMPVRTAGAEPSTSRAKHPGRAGLQLDGLAAKQEKALFVRRKC